MPIPCEKIRHYQEQDRRAGDYNYARARVPHSMRSGENLARGYDVAKHFAQVIAARWQHDTGQRLGTLFREQVKTWKRETGHLSSVTKAISHRSYLRIIGLARVSSGYEIERLLLKELESEPDHWFHALTAITGEDPVEPEQDFDEAMRAWLSWGREKGII